MSRWSRALEENLPAARLIPSWSVDMDLDGWEVCLAYHDGFRHDWRLQSYPWAGNSDRVTDAALQLLEMGFAKPARHTAPH
jgi:hypothetical protein